MTITLTRPAVQAGACVHFESVAWCAICTGTDRKGIDPFVGLGRSTEILAHTVRGSERGGRCPSCSTGYPRGVPVGYSPEMGTFVPTCCGIPTDDHGSGYASWDGLPRWGA
jgi:hypothetical protein